MCKKRLEHLQPTPMASSKGTFHCWDKNECDAADEKDANGQKGFGLNEAIGRDEGRLLGWLVGDREHVSSLNLKNIHFN